MTAALKNKRASHVRTPVAVQAPARLDNLTLARKEGWRRLVDTPERVRPDPLTRKQLAALSDDARED
ncbi:hypothetical protein RBA03_22605, partial [Mycobacteroides abscessus subsp. massiliense]